MSAKDQLKKDLLDGVKECIREKLSTDDPAKKAFWQECKEAICDIDADFRYETRDGVRVQDL